MSLAARLYLEEIDKAMAPLLNRPCNADLQIAIRAVITDINTHRKAQRMPFIALEHWKCETLRPGKLQLNADPIHFKHPWEQS